MGEIKINGKTYFYDWAMAEIERKYKEEAERIIWGLKTPPPLKFSDYAKQVG